MSTPLGVESFEDDVARIQTFLIPTPEGSGIGTPHPPVSLDATLTDVMTIDALTQVLSEDAAVARGDLWVADANPNMTLLNIGADGSAFYTDGNDPSWTLTPVWKGNHAWDDGVGDSPQVQFVGGSNNDTAILYLDDDAVANRSDMVIQLAGTDYQARLLIQDNSPATVAYIDADGNASFDGDVSMPTGGTGFIMSDNTAGYVAVADGARYVPTDPTTILPLPPVAQGDIIIADAVPEWSILTAGAQYTHLEMGAATATWVVNLTMADDAWIGIAANDLRVEFDSSDGDIMLGLGDAAGADEVQVLDNGNAVVAYIDSDGNADFAGHVAVGSGAGVSATIGLSTIETYTDLAGAVRGAGTVVNFNPGAGFTTSVYANSFDVKIGTAQTRAGGTIYGTVGQVLVNNNIDARSLQMRGVFGLVDVEDAGAGGGTGAVDATGGYFLTPRVDTGHCTAGNGVRIAQGAVGAGTMVTLYGLRIANINAGATNWGIYTQAGDCRFGDAVHVVDFIYHDADLDTFLSFTTDALDIQAGGVQFLTITEAAQDTIVINGGGVDVDFTVQANGVADALEVQGSDGQITLGALTAGYVKADAAGVLGIGTPSTDLPIPPVAEGDTLIADAVPAWTILSAPAAAGYVRVSTATTEVWDQTPTMTGDWTWESAVSTKPVLTIENTNADGLAPTIDFYKNTATPADGDYIGAFDFFGETSTGAKERYAYIVAASQDVTNGDTGGGLRFTVVMDSVERSLVQLNGYNGAGVNEGEVIINEDGQDVDFRVEASGAVNALVVQGSDGFVGMGTDAPTDMLHLVATGATIPTILIENTGPGITSGTLDFYKNTVSPADDDDIGVINFYGETSTGAQELYGYIVAETSDVTNTDTAGDIAFYVVMDAAEREMLRLSGYNGAGVNEGEITFNNAEQDVDFRVAASGLTNSFVVLGDTGYAGVNVAVPGAQLSVDQSAAAGAVPVLKLDQGDVSEQCIQFSSDGADQDFYLWTVEVTGTPSLMWDESEDAYSWNMGHILDDGVGDSPILSFVGGSNDDTILIFLDDDAVATKSDLVIRLADDASFSELQVQNSVGGNVAVITSHGTLTLGGSAVVAGQIHIGSTPGGRIAEDGAGNLGITAWSQGDDMYFQTWPALGAITTRLTITSTGNILLATGSTLDLDGIADALILDADADTTISAPTDDQIDFEVGGGDVAHIVATGLFVNATTNAFMTMGATVDQGANDDEAIAVKSSDVAHGMTDIAETDTYGTLAKQIAASGGLSVHGYTESRVGVGLQSNFTTDTTSHDATSGGAIVLIARKKSGTTYGNIASGQNILNIRGRIGGTNRNVAIFAEDGDLYLDTVTNENAWDEYGARGDLDLLHGMRASLAPDGHELKQRFAQQMETARDVLARTGVITYNEDGHHFIAMKQGFFFLSDVVRMVGMAAFEEIASLRERLAQIETKMLEAK